MAELRDSAIFNAARKLELPDEREAFLREACGEDQDTYDRVATLLQAYDAEREFLESPPAEVSPRTDSASITEGLGTVIGRYKLLEQIGEGGFAVVYLAEQTEPIRRHVALKIIKPGMDTRQVLNRFEAKRQALAMMDHPHIAKVYDAGATDTGRPYFVMELVRGVSITEYCDQCHLTTRGRMELFVSVCQAVQHAHQKGIIHRDIKPTNVLVALQDGRPEPKVIDFGIAKAINQRLTEHTLITAFAQMIGTPLYMSPEQAELSPLGVDTRSDIYSLGVLLYELLTGVTPFDKERLQAAVYHELCRIICEEDPPRPSARISTLDADLATAVAEQRRTDARRLFLTVRGDLDCIVMKCLEKERIRRYGSAQELAEELRRFLVGKPIHARPVGQFDRALRWAKRRPTLAALLAVLTGVAVIGPVVAMQQFLLRQQRDSLLTERGQALSQLADNNRELQSQLVRNLIERGSTEYGAGRIPEAIALFAGAYAAAPPDHPLRTSARNLAAGLSADLGLQMTLVHDSGVTAAALSPDGGVVVTVCVDYSVRIWQASTGKPIGEPIHDIDPVAFSPDSRFLLTRGADNTARLWDTATGKPFGTALRHNGLVLAAAFSPDSRTVLTGCSDNTGRLWNVTTGNQVGEPLRHDGYVSAVAFSPNGRTVLTGSLDKTARIWDVVTRKQTGDLMRHDGKVELVAYSADGGTLLTAANSQAHLWNAATARPLIEPVRYDGRRAVALGPEHGTFLVSTYNEARIFRPVRRELAPAPGQAPLQAEPVGEPMRHDGPVVSVAFSPNGLSALTGSWDKTARLWDALGRPLGEPLHHDDYVSAVAFGPDGRTVLTGSLDKTARLWYVASEKQIGVPMRHKDEILAAAFCPDGHTVVTGSSDKTAQLWNAETSQPLGEPMRHDSSVMTVAFSLDGRKVLTGSRDGTARVWDAEMRKPLGEPMRHEGAVVTAAFSPSGSVIVTGSLDKTARLWDSDSRKPVNAPMRHDGGVVAVAFSPNSRTVLTGSSDNTARLWDAATGKQIGDTMHHDRYVSAVAFSPDNRNALTGSRDHTACLWDAESGRMTGKPMRHDGPVVAVAFSPDGRFVLTGSEDDTARIWDIDTGKPIGEPMRHDRDIVVVAFSPDGKSVVTGSNGDNVRLWDSATGKPIGGPMYQKGAIMAAAFSSDGRTMITGSTNYTACLWRNPQLPDNPRLVRSWSITRTGMKLDDEGSIRRVSQAEWRAARNVLEQIRGENELP